MSYEAIKTYFIDGYQLLLDQINLSIGSLSSVFNLVVLLDILLLVVLLYWVWTKIRRTLLIRVLPSLFGILFLVFASKFLGFIALFYISILLLTAFLVAIVLIYSQEIQKLIESSFNHQKNRDRIRLLDRHELSSFVRQLTDTVVTLSKSKIPSLLVIKTSKPIGRLAENGIALYTPFNKEFVLDIFSHRSRLSSGALIIDNGIITATGSTLTVVSPKKFVFSLSNPVLKQVALHWNTVVIITYKHTENLSLLYGENSYSKLAPGSLERVLKTILLANK